MTDKFNARSPGEILRAAREKQGLHIAALAAAIKVAPRKLDALEHDRWDELPDATFIRALAQTVCRTLKIDPAPVMDLLPRPGAPKLQPDTGGLNMPFRERPGREEPGLALNALRPMVLATALLIAAAVAVYFLPDRFWAGKTPVAKPAAAVPASAPPALASAPESGMAAPTDAVATAMGPASAAEAASAAVPLVPLVPLVPPVTPSAVSALPPASAPVVAVATSAVTAAAVDGNRSVATDGPVQLRATGNSWVEVKDAGGRIIFSRVLSAGERVGLDGAVPMRMTIGNASVTELDYRGQAYDLKAVTINNVARVVLK